MRPRPYIRRGVEGGCQWRVSAAGVLWLVRYRVAGEVVFVTHVSAYAAEHGLYSEGCGSPFGVLQGRAYSGRGIALRWALVRDDGWSSSRCENCLAAARSFSRCSSRPRRLAGRGMTAGRSGVLIDVPGANGGRAHGAWIMSQADGACVEGGPKGGWTPTRLAPGGALVSPRWRWGAWLADTSRALTLSGMMRASGSRHLVARRMR